MDQEPITNPQKIAEALSRVEKGDKLTVTIANGETDTDMVDLIQGPFITFGDPNDGLRLIDMDQGTVHYPTQNPNHPLTSGIEITELRNWSR